jgi:predicted nucleic acid-binding protein
VSNAWLIDKSALAKLGQSPDVEAWANRIERGLVRVSTLTVLEMGFSARSGADFRNELGRPPIASFPREYVTPKIEDRAIELLVSLADRGQHRAPSIPDLLIAATAEAVGITVLHDDKDFELIATITGQPIERLQL